MFHVNKLVVILHVEKNHLACRERGAEVHVPL